VIFYTLQGPTYHLEIHDDKMKLVKKPWWGLFGAKNEIHEWKLEELAQFNIATPKFIWGKLEWANFSGDKCSFRFSTNAVMMNKIEKYIHKLILKNFQRRQNITPIKKQAHKAKKEASRKAA
jgi:hypothetical protein